MLLEARRAGDALLEAKAASKHGEFKAWVEVNTSVSYRTAKDYMQVAKLVASKKADLRHFDGGVHAFLREFSDNRSATKSGSTSPTTPPFTKTDAEYAQKLHALATRGAGNEADVAKAKLDSFAQQFGMTGARVVGKLWSRHPDRSGSDFPSL